MKNKGEIFIESLITLLLISLSLIPISNTIQKISNSNKKITNKYKNINNIKNFIEDIKVSNYYNIYNNQGKHNFKSIKEACYYFKLDFNNYENIDNKIELEIIKLNYFYNLLKKEYIFKIKVGEYEDIYIP